MDEAVVRWLVKKAGLFLHRPDKGTGVVVIHGYKKRYDPRHIAPIKRAHAARAKGGK